MSATHVLAGAPTDAGLTQSLGAMEGLPLGVAATHRKPGSGARALLFAVYPGLLAALTIALAATWLSQHYRVPVMLFALLFGMAFNFLHQEGRCVAGIDFVSKSVLRVGVALLGAKITAGQILGLGVMPLVTVLVAVTSTISLGALASKRFGQSRAFGVLTGGAVGICGASAALAIASILPQTEDSERDTILAVVTVTALSTIAMITYPLIAALVGLDHAQAGIFLGGTIHDVAQVVGAGYTVSPQTGDIATYVKLLRVALLLPAVLVLGLAWRGTAARSGEARGKLPFPLFLLGFAVLVAAGSFRLLPPAAVDAASALSRWCLVAAVAGLGMKTSFGALVKVGWRPVALIVTETVWIGGLVLAATLLWR
ncbi:YeiH family protein [Phenylobacterium sp.]|uniref:YeiH family protein n=1 Tax=Phenylobacterium sp. TaxID=1871053 RepID=UPI002F42C87C